MKERGIKIGFLDAVQRCFPAFNAVVNNLMHKYSEQPEQSSLHKLLEMRILISPRKVYN